MGLIDILTQYDAKKKAAHAAKTVKHGVRVPLSLSFLGLGLSSGKKASGVRPAAEGGQRWGRWRVPHTLFLISSHRRGQRSRLSILSSMLSDSWILLPTSLPKSLPDSVVIAALC